MCGISVLISDDNEQLKNLPEMNSVIRHRGPDDEGFAVISDSKVFPCYGQDTDPKSINASFDYSPVMSVSEALVSGGRYVAFGHRRLSIVDLTVAGHQPMCYDKKRFWITYNGEVFNFNEIKHELEAEGYSFLTSNDTEVILAAYARWGVDCLNKFNGMWAFVIYDAVENELFVARDRFGIKPLYFWEGKAREIAFASEIKQFTVLNGWKATANISTILSFLADGSLDYCEQTMFLGVRQVLPGHFIKINLNSMHAKSEDVQQIRWYVLPEDEVDIPLNDAANNFKTLLSDSIRLRGEPEVPIGSCLSGGLDSSSIVCVLNDILRSEGKSDNQNTFSMLSDNSAIDESKWINSVLEQTGAKGHFVVPSSSSCLQSLEALVWSQDEPFSSLGIYGQNEVFKLASSNGVKVMLDGQGADEYLAGYDGFFTANLSDLLGRGRFLSLLREAYAIGGTRQYTFIKIFKLLLNGVMSGSVRQFARKVGGYNTTEPHWLNVELVRKAGITKNSPVSRFGSIRELSSDQLTNRGIRALLHWEDRNSMAYSIEARVPFLDFRVVEYTLRLAPRLKLSGGVTKVVLRYAMKDILPRLISTRNDKLGFTTNTEIWMTKERSHEFEALLQFAVESSNGLIRSSIIDDFREVCQGRAVFNLSFWRVICFGLWIRVFDVDVKMATGEG